LGPVFYLEVKYRINTVRNISFRVSEAAEQEDDRNKPFVMPGQVPVYNRTFFGQLTGGDKIELVKPVSTQFSVVIPKINANAPVFPNVDAGNTDVYLPVLQNGVAHAAGTVFPGIAGNIFLFAHSTDNFWNVGRYNAVFYLLNKLEAGDEVNLFYLGRRFVYRVTDKIVVSPSEIHYLTRQTGYELLTLQTCWPPGTTFKRLLILAKPEKEFRQT
jgi:sortase A